MSDDIHAKLTLYSELSKEDVVAWLKIVIKNIERDDFPGVNYFFLKKGVEVRL